MTKSLRHPNVRPSHPAEVILLGIEESGVKKSDLARALGISRNTLYNLLDQRQSVTAEMALRLEAVWGSTAEFWLRLQEQHDLWKARQSFDGSRLRRICTSTAT